MPNPKVGTVTPDVATAVENAKAGQVRYRTDKNGIIHTTIGRKSFSEEQLKSRSITLIEASNKAKPAIFKGVYMRKVSMFVDHGHWRTFGSGLRWLRNTDPRRRVIERIRACHVHSMAGISLG